MSELSTTDTSISLSDEQRRVIELVQSGRNVFYTGPAGTGKSFVLKQLQQTLERCGKKAVYTACTGAAAVLIGGSTIHSFACIYDIACWDPTKTPEEVFGQVRKKKYVLQKACNMWSEIDVLFIDEISMMDGSVLDKLEYLARRYRRRPKVPWGGLQVVLTGDFLQLPPVQMTSFAFDAQAWRLLDPEIVVLRHVYRQDGDDLFRRVLYNVRLGNVTEEVVTALQTIQVDEVEPESEIETDGCNIISTNLYANNAAVNAMNDSCLKSLSERTGNQVHKFTAKDKGQSTQLLRDLQAAASISLCVGAQVMLLCNLNVAGGLANGTRGVVTRIDTEKNIPYVRFTNGTMIPVQPYTWKFEDHSQPGKKLPPKAERTQIPLRLAWAMTVHKSQGMTLDKVCIDCDLFRSDGQFYVALSRAKSLDSVRLVNFTPSCISASAKAVEFFTRIA